MNFKRFHESKNLWNGEGFSARAITSPHEHTDTNTYGTTLSTTIGKETIVTQSEYPTGTVGYQNGFFFIDVDFSKYEIGDKVTLSFDYICNEVHSIEGQVSTTLYAGKNSNSIPVVLSSGKWSVSGRLTAVITIIANMNPYVEVRLCGNSITVKNIMLNTGSEALPYEPYSSEVWHDIPHYIYNTSTDTITTLPAVLYPTGTTATVGLKGQAVQNGTPTSDNPIIPQGCGELEAGRYKIPISSASTTTPIYLGEVESTRQIKKLVLDGTEDGWREGTGFFYIQQISPDYKRSAGNITLMCTHYQPYGQVVQGGNVPNGFCSFYYDPAYQRLYIVDNSITSLADFKAYLAQQYANGTPVTVWYVLNAPETAVVNEPLMRIGNYADEVSGVSIPTIAGGDTLSVDTTVQPSEVTVNYKGWHPVQSVHERENGAWT